MKYLEIKKNRNNSVVASVLSDNLSYYETISGELIQVKKSSIVKVFEKGDWAKLQSVTKSKKTKKVKSKRFQPKYMTPLYYSKDLEAVIGPGPLTRVDIVKKFWGYIRKHDLQDSKNRRMINVDLKLSKVFKNVPKISMFMIVKGLTPHLDQKKYGSKGQERALK